MFTAKEREEKEKKTQMKLNFLWHVVYMGIYLSVWGYICLFVCLKLLLPLHPLSLTLSPSLTEPVSFLAFVAVFGFYLFIFFTHCLQHLIPLPPLHAALLSFDSFKFPMLPPLRPWATVALSCLIILMRLNASLSWNFIYLYLIFKQL